MDALAYGIKERRHGLSPPWPFTHVAEALDVLKPDVVLESLGMFSDKNKYCDGKRGSLKKLEYLGKNSQPRLSVFGSIAGGIEMEVLPGIVNHAFHCKKAMESHYDEYLSPQKMEQVAPSIAHVGLQRKYICQKKSPSSNITSENHYASSYELLEKAWDYNLRKHTQPSMVMRTLPASCKSSTSAFRHARQSSAASKLSMKKLPLRGFRVHVKVALKDEHTGKQDALKKRKKKKRGKESNLVAHKGGIVSAQIWKQLFCGGIAGVISRSVVAPVDLVKTYLITSHGARGSEMSAFAVCKRIINTSGWQGLFRGNLTNCIRVAPSKAIELCVFETVRRELNKEGHPLKNAAATIAGGAAGMAGTVTTYPLELIRTRLSVQPELYTGILQTCTKIFQEEGAMAFYSGLAPSLMGVFPYAATNYFVYDGLRTLYRSSTGRQHVPTVPTLAFGALAAAASSTVTYPLEVARRQLQLALQDAVNRSSVGIILNIYKHEGFLALYRGLGTTWLKLIPAAGISFVCYEAARLAFSIDDASILMRAKRTSGAAKEDIMA